MKGIKEFVVGERVCIDREVSQSFIETFAQVIGDQDPIHTDPSYAATTRYGRCIAHGVILDCLISAMLSELVPGGIDAKLEVEYTAPVFAGDIVAIEGVVVEVDCAKNRIYIETKATNQDGVVVEVGKAVCLAAEGDE